MMALTLIEGNLKRLPAVTSGKRDMSNALRSWTIGEVGEAPRFWTLYKAKFWWIVKPMMLQGAAHGNTLVFISRLRARIKRILDSDYTLYWSEWYPTLLSALKNHKCSEPCILS